MPPTISVLIGCGSTSGSQSQKLEGILARSQSELPVLDFTLPVTKNSVQACIKRTRNAEGIGTISFAIATVRVPIIRLARSMVPSGELNTCQADIHGARHTHAEFYFRLRL